MQLAATRPDLFDVAQPLLGPPRLPRASRSAQMADQLLGDRGARSRRSSASTKPWFRPPFGGWNDAVRDRGRRRRLVARWSCGTSTRSTGDPVADGGPTAAEIVARSAPTRAAARSCCMHLGGWNTLEALPGHPRAALDAKDLEPVTLAEMLGA